MSIDDIKSFEIKKIDIIFLFIWVILIFLFSDNKLENILFSMFFTIILINLWYFNQNKIGGGDVKVLSILSLIYGINIIYVLLIASMSGMIISLMRGKIPFLPFITIGVICLNIKTYLII